MNSLLRPFLGHLCRVPSEASSMFCEPVFVAEVTYTEITSDGKLRHPSFKGLRELADNVDVFELKK
ncbi:hypothetical protein ASD52_26445 [Ensifer sp. Root142]|uniref:ATP dependent DNA ligase n=1 Tax=Ensifer sp. Root142 TaxID=1736461 RepID=UPI00070DB9A4|nr:hypothetical protein ASD52_26445 [Ensifer sp. Root142]